MMLQISLQLKMLGFSRTDARCACCDDGGGSDHRQLTSRPTLSTYNQPIKTMAAEQKERRRMVQTCLPNARIIGLSQVSLP